MNRKKIIGRVTALLSGALIGAFIYAPFVALAQDWFEASGVPPQRGLLDSSELRSEFAAIEANISDKLPTLTGNANRIVRVNSGETALEASAAGVAVSEGGTGATTLTGILQGNGTSAITGITNSSTVGEVLRVTGSSTYAWGALDLADSDAITGDIPDGNLSSNVPLLDQTNIFTDRQVIDASALDKLRIKSDASGSSATGYISYYDDTPSRLGFIGYASGSNSDLYIENESGGNIRIEPNAGQINLNGAVSIGGGQTISDSDNVALLDQANVFTADGVGADSPIYLSSIAPTLTWHESDAATNEGVWDARASGERFDMRTVNDAEDDAEIFFQVTRSGLAVDTVAFPNGAVSITDSLAIGGGQTISDSDNIALLDQLVTFDTGTTTRTVFRGSAAAIEFVEDDAAADNQRWDFLVTGEQFQGRVINDAASANTHWLEVDRTGTTIDTVNFPNGELQYGGVELATVNTNWAASDITSGTFADARIAQSNVTQHEAAINHDALTNFVSNEHVDHSGVTLTAGAGLTGGGDITTNRSFAVGAGTGITVNANDVALSSATQTSLGLADTSVQPADNVSDLTNDAGYLTESTSTFMADFPNGCTTTPTASYSYTKIGNIVVLQLEADITCTGDTIAFLTNTGEMPAAIRPADAQCLVIESVVDNGTAIAAGHLQVNMDGTMIYNPPGDANCGNANWTASGSRQVTEHTVTYHLN